MKQISIKIQILVLIVLSLLFLGGITAFLGITKSSTALVNTSYDTLKAARDTKTAQIKAFFDERIGDIKVLSESRDLKEFIQELLSVSYLSMEVKQKGRFPIDNADIKEKIKKHEAFFKRYIEYYSYYDLLIISKEQGHVMYSVTKESDFGANLAYGDLKNSALGEVWKKVKDEKRAFFTDMKKYPPSGGEPAMFLGNPIIVNGKFEAILVFQISHAAINKIMTFREGYGVS